MEKENNDEEVSVMAPDIEKSNDNKGMEEHISSHCSCSSSRKSPTNEEDKQNKNNKMDNGKAMKSNDDIFEDQSTRMSQDSTCWFCDEEEEEEEENSLPRPPTVKRITSFQNQNEKSPNDKSSSSNSKKKKIRQSHNWRPPLIPSQRSVTTAATTTPPRPRRQRQMSNVSTSSRRSLPPLPNLGGSTTMTTITTPTRPIKITKTPATISCHDSFATPPRSSRHIPLRQRLDTEETARVCNGKVRVPSSPLLDQYKQQQQQQQEKQLETIEMNELAFYEMTTTLNDADDDDSLSVISSLSNDDSLYNNKNFSPVVPVVTPQKAVIPTCVEVSIPSSSKSKSGRRQSRRLVVPTPPPPPPPPPSGEYNQDAGSYRSNDRMEELIARLSMNQRSGGVHSPPPVVTQAPSPLVHRPTMGRHRSDPSTGMSFSSVASSASDASLLGSRKRRTHRRGNSNTTISVGSIVGQSSLRTAPTASSDASTSASAIKKAVRAQKLLRTCVQEGTLPTQRSVKRNIVKKEIKNIVGRMTSPIRNLPLLKRKLDLKRSTGTLT